MSARYTTAPTADLRSVAEVSDAYPCAGGEAVAVAAGDAIIAPGVTSRLIRQFTRDPVRSEGPWS
jgi:hypothetical protein